MPLLPFPQKKAKEEKKQQPSAGSKVISRVCFNSFINVTLQYIFKEKWFIYSVSTHAGTLVSVNHLLCKAHYATDNSLASLAFAHSSLTMSIPNKRFQLIC
ncbi:Uncharacterized protein TCM_024875 [Theobroma cacao]|uniref:Uncharacterized protein n=1 Tax=Theobroma cacao TaxID=3641 RepID=A0A061EWI7_THECC|nr:Uncharacterized protein TCM_024875 [Theobroma cacao]